MTWPILIAIAFLLLIAVATKRKQTSSRSRPLPYTQKQALFSPAERSFLGVLEHAIGNHYRIFGKVRLADVIETKRGLNRSDRQRAFNSISAKHFDFLLCDKEDLSVVCAIELDDKSHEKKSRRQRDEFLVDVCRTVALPLLQVQAKRGYSIPEIRDKVLAVTQQRLEPSPVFTSASQ